MARNPSLFSRKYGQLNSKPVFYFASEGEKTELQYLENLQQFYTEVVFKTIPLSHRDPKNLLLAMKRFITKGTYRNEDFLLIFVDRDNWEEIDLKRLWEWERESPENRMVLFSNPCFELWLLRHYCSGSGATDAGICHQQLIRHNPQLDKKAVPPNTFCREQVLRACGHAKTANTQNWKARGFTNIYRLIEILEKKNSLS